ncbi:MAG: cell surface protein [Muribaculaceae bacterium]|nr:cell surface protein [Muribaculaceae bacterium]
MNHKLLIPILGLAVSSCSDEIPTVSLGIDDVYYIARMQKLDLRPAFTGDKYEWIVNGKPVSDNRDFIFIASEEGVYDVELRILDSFTPYDFEFKVIVLHEEIEYSPFIYKVYEYCPAPGQFVNEMPKYEEGDTYDDILQKTEESITGTNDIMITLGGYGGYVTFGFDHTVINVAGQNDFRIWGNCFYEASEPEKKGGSAEPGIVMVSYDANCNGLPDDEWYELKGSEYANPLTIHNYSITYFRPDPLKKEISDDSGFLTDIEYIPWKDSEGTESFLAKNSFHSQSYWPCWTDADQLQFSGTRLPENAEDRSGTGRYYVLYSFDWGYVDNHPNEFIDLNSFDIGNAVDRFGNRINLPGADFIRVYTGINQYCGWLGETSTELSRAQDLHISLY